MFGKTSNERLTGIGKIGAEVLNLSIGILMNICAKLNICALNAQLCQYPKRCVPIALATTSMTNFRLTKNSHFQNFEAYKKRFDILKRFNFFFNFYAGLHSSDLKPIFCDIYSIFCKIFSQSMSISLNFVFSKTVC
jgi:hypothetical protein